MVRIAQVMRREQSFTATGLVLGRPNLVTQIAQAGLDNLPGPSFVVSLEVAHILQNHVHRPVVSEDVQDLMKERSRRLIA